MWWNFWKIYLFFSFYSALINIPTVSLFSLLPQHVKGHLNFVLQIAMWSENTVSQICRLFTYNLKELRLSLGSPGHVLLPFLPLPCFTSFLRWFTQSLQSDELQSLQLYAIFLSLSQYARPAETLSSWQVNDFGRFLCGKVTERTTDYKSHRLLAGQKLWLVAPTFFLSTLPSHSPPFILESLAHFGLPTTGFLEAACPLFTSSWSSLEVLSGPHLLYLPTMTSPNWADSLERHNCFVQTILSDKPFFLCCQSFLGQLI